MKEKKKVRQKPTPHEGRPANPVGFWDQSEPRSGIVSVRDSSSKLARSLAFLRRIVGWPRKPAAGRRP